MSNAIKTYDPKKVTMSFGSHIVTDFADDSLIVLEPGGAGIAQKYSCDGEIARSYATVDTFKVKESMHQT